MVSHAVPSNNSSGIQNLNMDDSFITLIKVNWQDKQ